MKGNQDKTGAFLVGEEVAHKNNRMVYRVVDRVWKGFGWLYTIEPIQKALRGVKFEARGNELFRPVRSK